MSGYHLYRSSNLQKFLDEFPEIFIPDNPLSDPVYIIVQNEGLGEWLSRYLTEKQGGVMGLNFLMPEQALRKFASGFPAACHLVGGNGEKILFLDDMQLILFKALEEIPETDEVFQQVHQYLSSDRINRLWELACTLAHSFHYYSMNCRSMVETWEENMSFPGPAGMSHPDETWQRHLWCRILHPNAPYAHLGQVLSAVSRSNEKYVGEDARIVLFGSNFLGKSGLEFFRKLAATLDIHHFMLSPCSSLDKPAGMYLGNNARLSAGINSLIPVLKPEHQYEFWDNSNTEDSTLHRLRSSLIKDEDFTGSPVEDGSLSFHNTPGIHRSIEILKDQILTALSNDEKLAPGQIGVLAPEIGLYAPFIATVFSSLDEDGFPRRDHLPCSITDLPARDESPFPSALSAMLDLPGSRFGRCELIRLLENPCIAPVAGDPALAGQWKTLIEDLNIRWGVDETHRRSLGAADPLTGSWQQGFQRILAGYYHDEGDDPETIPMPDISDSMAEDSGQLMLFIAKLDEEIRPLDRKIMSLRRWVSLWEGIIARWLIPRRDRIVRVEDEYHQRRIKRNLRDLNALSDDVDHLSDFSNSNLPWQVFRGLLDDFLSSSSGRRSNDTNRGVYCGSLKPTRAIPFRRIYVLGLDENTWPTQDRLTGFDLRKNVPGAIDLSRESIERFALLETLYSASDHLSLFYTGRDSVNGEALSPAAPVLDLMEYLGDGVEKLIVHHPLLPYDPSALTGEGPLATTSIKALYLAEERGRTPVQMRNLPVSPPENNDSVNWKTLVSFLKNPVMYFFRQRMGAGFLSSKDEQENYDLLELESLEWWKWRDETVREDVSAFKDPEKFIQVFCRRNYLISAMSNTPFAAFQSERWLKDAKTMKDQLHRITNEGFHPGPSFSCRLTEKAGDLIDHNKLHDIPNQEILNLPAPKMALAGTSPLLVNGDINGLRLLSKDGKPDRRVWTFLDFISNHTPNASYNLHNWVAALVLATALGENTPGEIRVFRIGARDYKARRYYFKEDMVPAGSAGEKRLIINPAEHLANLVNFYRRGQKTPLPLYPELAERIKKSADPGDDEDFKEAAASIWEEIVTNDFKPFSAMRDCPWRKRFLPNPPLDDDQLHRAYRAIYIEGGLL